MDVFCFCDQPYVSARDYWRYHPGTVAGYLYSQFVLLIP